MSGAPPTAWQSAEQRHLAAAQAWLLVRLQPHPPADTAVASAAAAALAAAESATPPPRAVVLRDRLGLSRFEHELLLLCACAALDPRVAHLCAARQGSDRAAPSFALAATILAEPAWDALSPARPLRRLRLVELGPGPAAHADLRVDDRVLQALQGLDHLDERLVPYTLPIAEQGCRAALPPSQAAAVALVVAALRAPLAPVVHIAGPDPGCNRLVLVRAAEAVGEDLVRIAADALPTAAADLDAALRLWSRETVLTPVVLHVDAADVPPGVLVRLCDRLRGALVLESAGPLPPLGAPLETIDVARPTPGEQRVAWHTLAAADAPTSARLAAQFDLGFAAIEHIARATEPSADLWQASLRHTRPGLDALAQRIDARRGWHDLVLPADDADVLHQLVAQVHQRARVYDDGGFRRKLGRGLGITALFAGESGTGKTLAAEVVADALGLLLYRVDLSSVVSKYIGETEKNLRRLFDAAEGGGAVLFFDEADALFGKRSEVRDSHDRYANIEVGYLLQRMEAFRGITILATNLKANLDAAFLRRIRFVVNFPFPGPGERERIWQGAFPAETSTAALDHAALARIGLTGGSIANIAVNAAFLAAAADSPVDMHLVLRATRTELRKLDRPAFEADMPRETP